MAGGRVWLITGASSGFGSAIAQAALAAGDRVVGAVRRPDRLQELMDAHPGRLTAVAFEVTDTARAAAVVQEVIDEHSRIDVLVNNAAYQSAEMSEYADTVGPTREYVRTGGGSQTGDPAKAAQAILTAIDSGAVTLRLVLGADAISGIDDRINRVRAELRQWDAVGRATAFDD